MTARMKISTAMLVTGLALILTGGCSDGSRSTRDLRPPETSTDPVRSSAGLKRMARQAAQRVGVRPELFFAVIKVESNWRVRAVSEDGAEGLSQVLPETARSEFGVTGRRRRFDPETNLTMGARYLARQLARFCSVRQGLAAYNAGPRRASRKPWPRETRRYVDKVLAEYRRLGGASSPSVSDVLVGRRCSNDRRSRTRTSESRESPTFKLTSAWLSRDEIRIGETAELKIGAVLHQAAASQVRIRVKLMEHPRVGLKYRSDLPVNVEPAGEGRSGSQIEARATRWEPGESHELGVQFVPRSSGTISFRYEIVYRDGGSSLRSGPTGTGEIRISKIGEEGNDE